MILWLRLVQVWGCLSLGLGVWAGLGWLVGWLLGASFGWLCSLWGPLSFEWQCYSVRAWMPSCKVQLFCITIIIIITCILLTYCETIVWSTEVRASFVFVDMFYVQPVLCTVNFGCSFTNCICNKGVNTKC